MYLYNPFKSDLWIITTKHTSNYRGGCCSPFPIDKFYVSSRVGQWITYIPVRVDQRGAVVQDPVISVPESLNEWPLVFNMDGDIKQST